MSKNVFVADTRNGGKVGQVIYLSVKKCRLLVLKFRIVCVFLLCLLLIQFSCRLRLSKASLGFAPMKYARRMNTTKKHLIL